MSHIPQDDARRKGAPMFRGLLGYFPAALFEVAEHSRESNDKHNPGEEIHWARGKSMDHADCIVRHLIDAGKRGTKGRRYHLRALAWRALAMLQEECEAEGATPGVSCRFPEPAPAPMKITPADFRAIENERQNAIVAAGIQAGERLAALHPTNRFSALDNGPDSFPGDEYATDPR